MNLHQYGLRVARGWERASCSYVFLSLQYVNAVAGAAMADYAIPFIDTHASSIGLATAAHRHRQCLCKGPTCPHSRGALSSPRTHLHAHPLPGRPDKSIDGYHYFDRETEVAHLPPLSLAPPFEPVYSYTCRLSVPTQEAAYCREMHACVLLVDEARG